MVYDDVTTDSLKYKVLAATRYGGWETSSSDEESLSDFQYIFVDIDRRGNLINTVHNSYSELPSATFPLLPPFCRFSFYTGG